MTRARFIYFDADGRQASAAEIPLHLRGADRLAEARQVAAQHIGSWVHRFPPLGTARGESDRCQLRHCLVEIDDPHGGPDSPIRLLVVAP